MSEIYRSEGNLLTETINKKISRRSFLKWTAAIGATTSVAGLITQKNKKAEAAMGTARPVSSTALNWMPTTCLVCHGWDAKAIGIDGNMCVRKIEGLGGQVNAASGFSCSAVKGKGAAPYDPDLQALQNAQNGTASNGSHRYYPGTRGKICAKGSNGMEHMYDPDRIKFPLIRTGRRGAGAWKRASWKQALRLTGRAIMDARGTKWDGVSFAAGNEWQTTAAPVVGPTTELRHAANVFVWRGRDEMGEHGYTSRFTKSIGCDSVAHTSLCEVSRHAAYATVYNHHFPMPDANNHIDPNDDCDIMVEFGGNGVEQKIPAYMTAQRWGDRRARGCRIVSADPRQSNSSAFADEWIQMRPGADGALAIAICHTIMTADGTGTSAGVDGWEALGFIGGTYKNLAGGGALKNYATGAAGWMNYVTENIVGLYPNQESAGTDPRTFANTLSPVNESLYSYVRNVAGVALENGGTGERNKVWGEFVTGINQATIVYLAKIFSHQSITYNGSPKTYRKPQWNCYRGPAKHTNGTYATKAGECLNILSGGQHNVGCGNSRHNWPDDTPHVNFHLDDTRGGNGNRNGESVPRWDLWDYIGGKDAYQGTYAGVDQNTVPSLRVGIGIDSGVAPSYAYRTSVARAAGTLRIATQGEVAPKTLILFKNAPTQTRGDKAIEEELFTATWTGTTSDPYDGGEEYKLKHAISIDLNMGDGTRLVDIILPDGSYLERNDLGIVHTHAFAGFNLIRQPVLRKSYPPKYENHDIITLHRIHQAQSIMRGISLATDVEYACTLGGAVGSSRAWGSASKNLGEYFFWGTYTTRPSGLEGSVAYADTTDPDGATDVSMMKDMDDAIDNYWLAGWGGSHTPSQVTGEYASYDIVTPSGPGGRFHSTTVNASNTIQHAQGTTAQDKYNWLMQNGSFWATPEDHGSGTGTRNWNQWYRHNMTGAKRGNNRGYSGAADANAVCVYSHIHGRGSWSPDAANLFYGGPVYVPIETVPGTYNIGTGDMNYPLQHTTMKRNVHTQSRTASLPRLMEILSSNPMWISVADAAALSVSNGDLVKVYTPRLRRGARIANSDTRTGAGGPKAGAGNRPAWAAAGASVSLAEKFEWDGENNYVVRAFVTPRMMNNVVATSTSFGHSVGRDGTIDSFAQQAFAYPTSLSNAGTSSRSTSALQNRWAPGGNTQVTPTSSSLTIRPSSAPGGGWNPNWGLHRLTDPLGGSLAWFDNVCRIVKI